MSNLEKGQQATCPSCGQMVTVTTGILPTTPPPPPPPDLHTALDRIDVRRVVSLLPADAREFEALDRGDMVRVVIDAIREQLPPPVTR